MKKVTLRQYDTSAANIQAKLYADALTQHDETTIEPAKERVLSKRNHAIEQAFSKRSFEAKEEDSFIESAGGGGFISTDRKAYLN